MNKTTALLIKVLLGTILTVAVMFSVYYGVRYYSDADTMALLLQEGNEYMDVASYEAAISTYDEALELEPDNIEIRNAIANAYVLLARDYGSSEEAVEQYRNALIYNGQNRNAYWGIIEIYEELGDEDRMLESLNQGYENTGDANMQFKADFILSERARIQAEEEERLREEAEEQALEEAQNELLAELFTSFESKSIDEVKELIREERFIELSDEIIGDKSFYYGEKDENGDRSGKGLGAYADGFYYYGDYEENIRKGQGLWIRATYSDSSAIGSFIYDGQWDNDKPNGNGTSTTAYYAKRVENGGMTKQIVSGNYVDGLENGKMSLAGTLKTGGNVKYSYNCENGIAGKASNANSGVSGQYIIAVSKDGSSNLTSDGSVRGVEGFLD